ncbi:phosphatase PAP2 family protein [Leucobacter soli]|uniref:Phosphatidic acid phosphatase type 2/haloperoxidase domain-containing protein n=1 Tax=Leucobacter soli TaxID=2812850 RepID=A0A916JWU7_9MICO|nr:phosphatase PAP2 family protein [Leucobacter soli]CAG7603099.1 hypothetical protein LEUCIP111803_00618 [Leucobacter soli]
MNGVGRGKALLYALFALGVGVVSYVIGVQSGIGQLAEQSVLGASEFTFDPPAPLSLVSTWSVGAALLVILLVAWRYRGFGRALWIVLFGGAAILASQLLKQEWLIRPSLLDFEADNTFPSGHMTVFAVVVGGAIWALPAASRGVAGVLGAMLLGTASWQLLAFGWHRPSDVFGGLALGVLAFGLAAAFRLPRRARTVRLPSSGANALNKVLGVVLTVSGWALVVGGLIVVAGAATLDSGSMLLGGSEIALVGASALTARAYMTLGA